MIRTGITTMLLLACCGIAVPELEARPEFLMRFQNDPFRMAAVDGCSVCHENPDGGGPRNVFGQAFESARYVITPTMRADFPDRFNVETAELPDGTVFYFADPESETVVVERESETFLIDLAAVATGSVSAPDRGNSLSFFVTSTGMGDGGNLGAWPVRTALPVPGRSLRSRRQNLARLPQHELRGRAGHPCRRSHRRRPMVQRRRHPDCPRRFDLHAENSRLKKATALDESGGIVPGIGDDLNHHDMLTGSLPDGTAAVGMNCNNWTGNGEGSAMVGHHHRLGGDGVERSWNSVHATHAHRDR